MRNESYPSPRKQSTALAAAAADLALCRWQKEVVLLAPVAPLGRWGLALAGRAGIGTEHFTADDTAAIWVALQIASDRGAVTSEGKFMYARRALQWAGHWRDDDERSFVGGSSWGPGPLAALFTRMGRDAAEAAIPAAAADLLAFDPRWDELCRRAWAEAAA